ncbi:hypothetical protein NSS98_30815 [Paenibacillus sp. FSL E2-0274]|uniref:hypothetical protein n=1 Tax=Paenibacillus TaxID=44249 RepID=UPI00096D88AF|nr:hypothetical protein [Paenibacillus odorifer]OMD12612.1 hypothetical protein BJP47_05170 [Paenibacillus odorifer]OME36240.1 hypothetical protein BSK63_03825 [Paenibacillus odorifer]
MLKLEVREMIGRMYFLENRSLREISKLLKLHRNTVRKYVSRLDEIIVNEGQHQLNRAEQLTEMADRAFEQGKYSKGNRLTEGVIAFIEQRWVLRGKKTRMALYQELRGRKHRFSAEGVEYEIECLSISYSTFYKAVKVAEQRIRQREEATRESDDD